jgi:hypothetical protein
VPYGHSENASIAVRKKQATVKYPCHPLEVEGGANRQGLQGKPTHWRSVVVKRYGHTAWCQI